MTHRLPILRFILVLLCTLLFGFLAFPATAQDNTPTAHDTVTQAWQLAQTSGTYHYRSVVEQTSYPAPGLANAGRAPIESRFGLEGQVNLAAETLEMTLWRDASFDPARGIAMRVEGDTAYGRVGNGEWEEVQNISEAFAPAGDPLAFLAGVKNVAEAGAEERNFGDSPLALNYTRYTFEVDGSAFGDHVRRQLEARMRESGELPAGVSLDTPRFYQELEGTGAIWLDEAGLPARLTVNLDIPDPKTGARATATITNDYWDFDQSALTRNSTPLWQLPTAWLSRTLPQDSSEWGRIAVNVGLVASVCTLMMVSLRLWRLKQFYAAVVGAVILSMVLSPLMQSGQVYAFAERTTTQQAEQAAHEDEQAKEQEQLAAAQAEQQPEWNPHRNPLAPIPPALQAAREQIEALESRHNAPHRQSDITTTDSDSDGLSDSDEALWGSCPSSTSASEFCDGVADPTDSDGDGFTDGTEVNQLATLPARADSDGDGISDWLEVKGFTYNGTQWYLNPNESDSNYDGFADGFDCPVWSTLSSDYNPTAICPDSDNDGTPDLFDNDNDGDSVNDDADLSPSAMGAAVYSNANPLTLELEHLETNQPVMLTLQFRPTAGNITHQSLVLDWPSGDDAGHIQRQLDNTFATTTNPDAQSTDILAGNGDVRLTPLLEITMPYTTGHYANLPVNSTYAGTNRTIGVGVDEWLDGEALELYGVDLQDVDESSGDLVAYLPLGTDTGVKGDEAVAFNARMLYYPTQGTNGEVTWGEAHQFRLIWLVQMLQDRCINDNDDPATCEREESLEVVHIYEDEWTLSGLQVTEEHGTDVAVLYENPALDDNFNLDDHLWSAAWNLSNTFMQGRDCDVLVGETCQSDGNRDVTIANMATVVDEWSSGTHFVTVETFSGQYEHQHEALAGVGLAMQSILTDTFGAYTTATAPTLLLASEQTVRTVNLADSAATATNHAITLDFDPDSVLTATSVGLNWQPYHYVNGEWAAYDIEDYLALLDVQVQADPFFDPEDESATAAEEVEGKRLWAQYYYTLLYQGLTALAEIDGTLIWAQSDGTENIPESTYEAVVADVSFVGITFIGGYYAFIAIEAIKAAAAGASVSQSIWSGLLRDGSTYSFGKSALLGTGLMAGLFITAVVGIGLYVAGYLTGNGTLVEIGKWVLTITAIISPTIWLITMLVQVVQAVQAGIAAGVGLVNMLRAVLSVSQGFPVYPAVMLAVTIAITLIFFIYALVTMDLKNNPAAIYALAAYTLASIYVQLIIFAIGLIPVIGQIIVVLILITDAILMILGYKSATAWVTEQIAKVLYDYDTFLKLDDPDRLEFSPAGSELVNPEVGFDVTNAMTYSLQVTNTIEADDYKNKGWIPDPTEPTPWLAIKYSTFRYFLKPDDEDEHSSLRLYQMENEWDKLGNKRGRTVQTATGRFEFESVGTGVNRNFSGAMYLVESYAATYVLCFKLPILLPVFDEVCTWHSYKDSIPINIGQYVEYDILPETVAEFANVHGWNRGSIAFPQQRDQDGDGLFSTAQGGVDVNDRAHDSDGDGLSDPYEAGYGTDMNNADSDGDGLNDADELQAFTDPLAADTDADGLSDYTELVEGWIYAFPDENGTYILTRVWSDPLNGDADNDTLSDLEEFVFGTHPRVATDPSFIKDIIRFDNLTVSEASHLQLLTRFKEGAGATAFADLSGNDNSATCTLSAGTCPTAGVNGRYGTAGEFDGTEYLNTGGSVVELGKADFTVAAWVKTTGTTISILAKNDGDTTWETGEKSLFLDGSGRPVFVGWGNEYIRGTNSVNDGEWHHVATVWDYSGSGDSGTGHMYVDGVDVTAGTTNYHATYNDNATDSFWIARANHNVNEAPNHFNGILDEVTAFNSALSAEEITALVAGRYNPGDLVVVPDSTLTYQATITNTHPTQGSDGLLSANVQYADPEIGNPQLFLRFEDADQILSFVNGVGDSTTATCPGDGTCPDYEAAGKYGNGGAFDGTNDSITIPALANTADTQTLAFWLKVDSLPASGQQAMILDTASNESGALDISLNSDGNLVFTVEGAVSNQLSYCPGNTSGSCTYIPWTGDHVSDYSFSGNLGTWVHFIWINYGGQSRIYINGNRDYWDSLVNYTTLPQLVAGPGTMGNDSTATAPLDATVDEFVFYNETVQSSTSLSSLRPFEQIRDGNYWIALDIGNISDHVPTFLLTFNEDPSHDPLVFDNTSGNDLTCPASSTCPTLDEEGNGVATDTYNEAIAFDGVDDYLPLNGDVDWPALDIWVDLKVTSLPPAGQTATLFDYGPESGSNGRIYAYLNSSGQVVVNVWRAQSGSYGTAVASTAIFAGNNLGVWKSLYFDFSYEPFFDNLDYVLYVDGVQNTSVTDHWTNMPALRFGSGRIGNNEAGTSSLNGSIDNFIVRQNSYRYNLTFEVDSPRDVQYINHATSGKTTTCIYYFACPTLDANGALGEALAFDGDDFLIIEDTDFARGDYTVGLWFKSSASGAQQTLFAATNTATDQHGVSLELQANGTLRYLHRFPTAASGGVQVVSPTPYNDGQWHYATIVYEDTLHRLYVDGAQVGVIQNSADTGATTLLDVTLGRLSTASRSNYFTGSLDEITIIPAATSTEGIALLMADQVPAMTVADDFVQFSAAPLSGTEVSGTISVASDAPTSIHRFTEEVEAALQLSQDITIPVIDDRAADLLFFIPFEDVPASTTFENVVSSVEQVCNGSHCPVAGIRGRVDRAAYFDGVDDYINTYQVSEGSAGSSGDVVSIAVWVKANQGTILDMTSPTIGQDYGGMRLTTNRLDIVFEDGSQYSYYDLPITLPENEWAHLVTTYDSGTQTASVYVNGALQTSETFGDVGEELQNRRLRIGLNKNGLDALHGYLDDLRMYDVALTAGEVQSLYLESSAVLRFEFDEESGATTFTDSSIYAYSGVPTLKACVPFTLDTLTVNNATTDGRDLYAYFNGARFMQESDVATGATFNPNRNWTVCGGETIAVGFIEEDGTATNVGSYTINGADVATVAASTTGNDLPIQATLTSGGNSISIAGSLTPEPTYLPNPAPGTDGQIGNTAFFDGAGAIEIESPAAVNALTNGFTIIGWINPEQLNSTQQIFAAGQDDSSNGFAFGVVNDKLRFSRLGGTNYDSTTALDANVWQQVAVVFDSSNDAHFYMDGVLKNSVAGATAISPNSDDPWYIGATTTNTGALTQQFAGQIDEFSIYSRALSDEEIISIYLRELRWYRARATAYLNVDNDLPTIELLTPNGSYYKDGYIQLAVTGADGGSEVELMDVGVRAPNDSDFTWSNAPVCVDAPRSGTAWCPAFTSSGEGMYTVKFRAVDSVGNEAYSQTYTLYVDDTAPTTDSPYNGEWRELTPNPDVRLSWTVELSGTIGDPTLPGGTPGSGLYTETVHVALVDGAGVTLNDDPQIATVNGNIWTVDYQINGVQPLGKYTLWVTAEDKVGNTATTDVALIQLDARESQAELDYWNVPEVITDTTTLTGTVNEQPAWAGLVAQYHLEESGNDFYDGSYYTHHAVCNGSSCPAPAAGQFGQALAFDGVDDALTATDVFTDGSPLDLATLALSLWLYPTQPGGATGSDVLVKGDGSGTNYALSLAPNSYTVAFTADDGTCAAEIGTLESTTPLVPDSWTHIGVTYDGATARLYRNGVEDATAAWAGGLCHNNAPLRMGGMNGRLDEVRLFDRALVATELYALAQSVHRGVAEVDVAILPFDAENEEVALETLAWDAASLSAPNGLLSTWQYTVPGNTPEGFYSIYLRGRDLFGNESGMSGVWRGAIDTEAPRLTFTATTYGSGATQYTDYAFTIADLLLDPATIDSICGTTGIHYSYHTGTELPNGVNGSCRVQAAPEPTTILTACDYVDHCNTITVGTPTTRDDASVIIVPTVAEIYQGLDPITIDGLVLSPDGLQSLDVTLDGQTIYSDTWASGVTSATWSTEWSPPTFGTYELEATLTTEVGAIVTDPFTNTFIVQAPALTLTKTVTPTIGLRFGDPLTYTLTLTNSGDLTATNVLVNDTLPEGISGVNLSETITITPGSMISFTIPATISAEITPTITNTAQYTHTWQQDSADVAIQRCDVGVVTNENDSGSGSLRQAVANTCSPATIYFTDDFTIYLSDNLTVSNDMTFEGTGYNVVISGDSDQDGDGDVQPFRIEAGTMVTLTHMTIISGTTSAEGGGAIYNEGNLWITDSHFEGNRSTTNGGGAIYSTNALTVTGSTFINNEAPNGGAISVSGQTTIANSTFSGNSASGDGGAVRNSGTFTFTNNTIADNSATADGSGLYNSDSGTLALNNTLFSNNTGGLHCVSDGTVSGGNNLSDGASGCTVTTMPDLLLSPLGEYGGDTRTYALLLGSPALDAGNDALCAAAPVNNIDQRGEARPTPCDIGAFEAYFALALTGGNRQSTTLNSPFAAPLELTLNAANGAPIGTEGVITFTGPISGAGISETVSLSPDGNGIVRATVTANGVVGTYEVTATTPGATSPVVYTLTNKSGLVILDNATFDVDEDAPNGTVLGTVPTNNQTGTSILYSITEGDPDGLFGLDGANGQLTIADNSKLDYDTTPLYTLEVIAGNGVTTDSATITVNVNDLLNDLSISKSAAPDTVPAEGVLTYTLTFENLGRDVARGVLITDILPVDVTVLDIQITADAGVTVTLDTTDPYRWKVSDLLPDRGGVITLITEVAADVSDTAITNTAQIGSDDPESDNDNNQSTVTTPLCYVETDVTSDADNGVGSLRTAIEAACPGGTITFSKPMTITLQSPLAITKSLTIDGDGHPVVVSGDAGVVGEGADNVTVFDIASADSVTLHGLTIRDGYSSSGAGGVQIENSTVTIQQSLITANLSGGIANNGTLILRESTVSGNEADNGAGLTNGANGSATLRNSTLSGNLARESGGAILNSGGTITITHSTIVSNHADGDEDTNGSGGGIFTMMGMVTVTNSIIAGNLLGPIESPGSDTWVDNDCAIPDGISNPPIHDGGYNLIGTSGGCPATSATTLTISRTDLFAIALEPLGNYGGTTPTHALRNASPAIDIIPGADCPVPTDQRGAPRANGVGQGGTACDIGAYEAFSTVNVAGDVSCDNRMNTADGLFAFQFDGGSRTADYACGLEGVALYLPACDTNQDGTCTSDDGLLMLQCDVGLQTPFCPTSPFGVAITPPWGEQQRGDGVVRVGSGALTGDVVEVTVPITVTMAPGLLGAVHVVVTYNDEIVAVSGCSPAPTGALEVGFCNHAIPGQVAFNAIAPDGAGGADLTLGTITFRRNALANDTATTVPLPVSVQTLTAPSGAPLSVRTIAGQLLVEGSAFRHETDGIEPTLLTLGTVTATAPYQPWRGVLALMVGTLTICVGQWYRARHRRHA